MKTSKYPEVTSSDFRTSTQKSSADEPDSTVVIGDSDSGSSDVQLIGKSCRFLEYVDLSS